MTNQPRALREQKVKTLREVLQSELERARDEYARPHNEIGEERRGVLGYAIGYLEDLLENYPAKVEGMAIGQIKTDNLLRHLSLLNHPRHDFFTSVDQLIEFANKEDRDVTPPALGRRLKACMQENPGTARRLLCENPALQEYALRRIAQDLNDGVEVPPKIISALTDFFTEQSVEQPAARTR